MAHSTRSGGNGRKDVFPKRLQPYEGCEVEETEDQVTNSTRFDGNRRNDFHSRRLQPRDGYGIEKIEDQMRHSTRFGGNRRHDFYSKPLQPNEGRGAQNAEEEMTHSTRFGGKRRINDFYSNRLKSDEVCHVQKTENPRPYYGDKEIEEDDDSTIRPKPRKMMQMDTIMEQPLPRFEKGPAKRRPNPMSDRCAPNPVNDPYAKDYLLKPLRYQPKPPVNTKITHSDIYTDTDESENFNVNRKAEDYQFDAFDCREYLIEIGLELVPKYRYNDGINEVYKRLMCRYGDVNITKSVGVFRSLLLDSDPSGYSEDGGVYRSWKFDYKHQRDDLSNPGTPRFRNCIFPADAPVQAMAQSSPRSHAGTSTVNDDVSEDSPSRDVGAKKLAWRARSEAIRKKIPNLLKTPFRKSGEQGLEKQDNEPVTTTEIQRQREEASAHLTQGPVSDFNFGFDGAADCQDLYSQPTEQEYIGVLTRDEIPTQYPIDRQTDRCYNSNGPVIDLNRALPTIPANTHQYTNMYDPVLASANQSTSSAAVTSTHHSHSSSKSDFRNLTRELLIPAFSEPSASPHQSSSCLDPNKFSPPPSREGNYKMTDPYDRYMSLANRNPFSDERQTRWPHAHDDHIRWLQDDFASASRDPAKSMSGGMSHSRSEGNVGYMTGLSHIDTSKANRSYVQSAGLSRAESDGLSPIRGRSKSPIKVMDEIKEHVAADIPAGSRKRSRSPIKKIFGDNGWLGRSISMKELSTESPKKTGLKHWGGKLMQRVEGITDDMSKKLPNPFHAEASSKQQPTQSKFPVSLNPLAQAKLYSEIELMICATANAFLLSQKRRGLMSIDSLAKVVEHWKSKNRPQVIQFQFDQLTQRDLILYNMKSFQFCGPQANDVIAINSMMYNWKSVGKEMSVRTFCTPDSVIRKQITHVYAILELLGAPEVTFLAFQNISVQTAKTMRDAQRKRDERQFIQYGVERPWYPPTREKNEANAAFEEHFER